VPIIGLGIGVSTLVGQYLGDNKDDLAARATWTGLQFTLGFSVLFAAAYWFVPDWFIYFHEQGASATEFAEVRELTIVLLRFVAVYCLFDATQLTFVSALKGAGDTRFVLFVAVFLTSLSIIIGSVIENHFRWGVYGWWYVMTGWICAMALVYLLRFLHGGWRKMRVIEPELVPKAEEI
jgi:MATE family multidrug resistance protein